MALAAVAVLIGAALQSATGFGFALVAAPAIFHALDPDAAVTVVTALSLVLSLLVLFGERRVHHVRGHEVRALVGWAVPGLVLGVVVLGAVGKPALQIGVGAAVVAAVAVDARGHRRAGRAQRAWPPAPAGLLTGSLTTTTGVNGPPLLIWFQRRGAGPAEVRDSLAACFALLSGLSICVLLAAGRLGLGSAGAPWLAGLVALVALGRPAGRIAFLRLDHDRFRAAGAALAVIAGLASIVSGAAA